MASSLREFKFVVQAVLLREEDGEPLSELAADVVTVYGLEGLRAFVERFPEDLQRLNAQQ